VATQLLLLLLLDRAGCQRRGLQLQPPGVVMGKGQAHARESLQQSHEKQLMPIVATLNLRRRRLPWSWSLLLPPRLPRLPVHRRHFAIGTSMVGSSSSQDGPGLAPTLQSLQSTRRRPCLLAQCCHRRQLHCQQQQHHCHTATCSTCTTARASVLTVSVRIWRGCTACPAVAAAVAVSVAVVAAGAAVCGVLFAAGF